MAEKEHAISENRIRRIGTEVSAVCPDFDAEAFADEVIAALPGLALKARIARTSRALRTYLPGDGLQAVDVLLRSLPASPPRVIATPAHPERPRLNLAQVTLLTTFQSSSKRTIPIPVRLSSRPTFYASVNGLNRTDHALPNQLTHALYGALRRS